MSRNKASFLVVGALGSLVGFSAQALSMSLAPIHAIPSDVTPVAGGCGIGFHRSVYGYCVRNGYVAAPYYAPPALVHRHRTMPRQSRRVHAHILTGLTHTAAVFPGDPGGGCSHRMPSVTLLALPPLRREKSCKLVALIVKKSMAHLSSSS